ncbi:putative oxygen-evolving enhancer protein [Dioscorea sansibarensis]
MVTSLTSINGASQILLPMPKPKPKPKPQHTKAQLSQESPSQSPNTLQTSRRTSIGLSVAILFNHATSKSLLAEEENNGFWLTGPLPVPSVSNDIANKETGTRTFIKKGVYMPNIGVDGSKYRLRMCAFDLLALGDMLTQDTWNYFRRYLCLKSTTMYFDFDKVITAASDDQKPPLLDLANKLFDNVEKLEDAARQKKAEAAKAFYADTEVLLKEVMTRMQKPETVG